MKGGGIVESEEDGDSRMRGRKQKSSEERSEGGDGGWVGERMGGEREGGETGKGKSWRGYRDTFGEGEGMWSCDGCSHRLDESYKK